MTVYYNEVRKAAPAERVVNIHNEWDPLEEVIVGSLEGFVIPPWEPAMEGCMYKQHFEMFAKLGGRSWNADELMAAERDLNEFIHILKAEGIRVRRPAAFDFGKAFASPDWSSESGLGAANPRDSLLVIGDEFIETPMAWRSRQYETFALRDLLHEYWKQGAGWVAAPKPRLTDAAYTKNFKKPNKGEEKRYILTEAEPIFDAADIIKCGRDIFAGRSSTCNHAGIEWLASYLSRRYDDTYRVHELFFDDEHPMHIDATFYPLAPGKLLVHPDRVAEVPTMFRGWDVLRCPEPALPIDHPLYFSSRWMNLNVLMLDEKRVVVEKGEEPTIRAFKKLGLEPIPCSFKYFNSFGGSFHCATLDIRRRGKLQNYF